MPTNKKNILIIRFSAMGDVAMTSPIVRQMVEQNPDIRVIFLTRSFFAPFFQGILRCEVLGIDLNHYKGVKGIFRLFQAIRKQYKIDLVLDMHDVLRSKLLRLFFRLSGTPVYTIDKGRKAKKKLITPPPHKVLKQLKPTTERYFDLFRKSGFCVDNYVDNWLTTVHNPEPLPLPIFEKVGGKQGKWIGIAPFAQHKGKIYPLERMEEVIRSLASNAGNQLFIFSGGGKEREEAERIAASYSNVTVVFGLIRLEGELALISNLDCMVSMDSSAMHMASLKGIPVVSIWGATHPYAGFLGYGQPMSRVVGMDMECRPCSIYGNKPCLRGDYACLNNIEPQRIVETVNKIIN